jgi:hypothetical protein
MGTITTRDRRPPGRRAQTISPLVAAWMSALAEALIARGGKLYLDVNGYRALERGYGLPPHAVDGALNAMWQVGAIEIRIREGFTVAETRPR